VQVTDSIGLTATRALQLDLTPLPALTITTLSLAPGTQGQPYNAQVDATGGTGAGYQWSVTTGTLPTGITLSMAGTPFATLAGLPTAAGTFNFTVQVEDSLV
jgi:hypothetical protein